MEKRRRGGPASDLDTLLKRLQPITEAIRDLDRLYFEKTRELIADLTHQLYEAQLDCHQLNTLVDDLEADIRLGN